MDYKGQLLQWCAKHKAVCKFKTVRVHGPPHSLSFIYSVTVNGDTVQGEVPKTRIKAAQREAARVYIEATNILDADAAGVPIPTYFPIYKDTCYYIDLENCPGIDLSVFPEYVSVASEASPRSITSRATHLTSCTRSDAADVALIMQLTSDIVLEKDYARYAVVSRDKLLLTAVEVLRDAFDVDIISIYP